MNAISMKIGKIYYYTSSDSVSLGEKVTEIIGVYCGVKGWGEYNFLTIASTRGAIIRGTQQIVPFDGRPQKWMLRNVREVLKNDLPLYLWMPHKSNLLSEILGGKDIKVCMRESVWNQLYDDFKKKVSEAYESMSL